MLLGCILKPVTTSSLSSDPKFFVGLCLGQMGRGSRKSHHPSQLSPCVPLCSEGSNLTPAHHFQDFRFKTYAPVAFRYFRELFGIRPDDYLVSVSVSITKYQAPPDGDHDP